MLLVIDRTATIELDILDQMFRYDHVNLDGFTGFVTSAALLMTALTVVAFGAVYIVGRAKKCLDFVATLFFVHLGECETKKKTKKSHVYILLPFLTTPSPAETGHENVFGH